MSKFHDMLKKADYYSSPVTKEQVNKLRQLRNQARAQGKKFNVGDHVSAGAGQTLKNVYDTAKAGAKGWAAGAWSAPLKVLQVAGSDWADKKLDDLSQWSGASRGSLDTGGAIGAAGYATLLSALGASAAGVGNVGLNTLRLGARAASAARNARLAKDLIGTAYKTRGIPGLINIGARGAGKGLQLAGKGLWKGTKLYAKHLGPWDALQGGSNLIARNLNNYKVNVARALAQGDQSYLKTDKEKQLFQDIVNQQGLGTYNPEDPASYEKWQHAGLQLMDDYRKDVGNVTRLSNVPLLLMPGKLNKVFGAIGLMTGGAGGSKASWQLAHTPGAQVGQSMTETSMQDLVQSDPRWALLQGSTLGRFIAHPVAQRVGLLPSSSMHAAAQRLNNFAAQNGAPLSEDARTTPQMRQELGAMSNQIKQNAEPGILQKGVNLVAGTFGKTVGKPLVQDAMMQNVQLFRQLGQAQTPEEKEKILQQLRQKSRQFLNPNEGGIVQGAKRHVFKTFMQDPKSRQETIQKFVNGYSPEQKAAVIRGYKIALQDPSYAQTAGTMSKGMQQNVGKFVGQLTQAQQGHFMQGLKEAKDVWSYLDSYGGIMDELKNGTISQDSPVYKSVKTAIFDDLKKRPWNVNKAMGFMARTKGYKSFADMLSNSGLFYGGLAALTVGLPLTVSLISSLFGGKKEQPQVVINNNAGMPTYKSKGITQRGIAYG